MVNTRAMQKNTAAIAGGLTTLFPSPVALNATRTRSNLSAPQDREGNIG